MLFPRSRHLFIPALALCSTLVLSACMSKPSAKEEVRLPRVSQGGSGSGSGSGFGPGGDWNPAGAPGESDFALGNNMSLGGDSLFGDGLFGLDETGSLMNTASTNGVDSGLFTAELEMIHFMFDDSTITPEWGEVLMRHGSWINQHPSIMVQVEGHTDERGTEEYNIALGQRRADAVRSFLVEQAGVDPNRLSTISYGKMRPLTWEQDEQSHALNRRAMFLVYELDNSVASAQ